MIDNTQVLSRPLAYGLVGFGLLFSCITLFLLFVVGARPLHYSPEATSFLIAASLAVTPVFSILATKYHVFTLPAIAWAHIVLMGMLLFFSEINGPFTALWTLVILITTLYYGWKGFISSSLSLVVGSVLYIVLFQASLGAPILVYAGIATMINFFAIFTSYLFVRIIMSSRKKNNDLIAAQRSERMQVTRQNTLLNSISDAVLTLNRYGRVTSQNAAAQAFFDTNQSLIGRDLEVLLTLVDAADQTVKIHDLIHTVQSTLLRDDLSMTDERGERKHLSLQMSRIRGTFDDDEEYGVVVIIRDITKQKSLEEEKDEFISVASHELRTPVAIAEGSLSNLLVMYEKDTDQEVLRSAAVTAYDQVIYLSKIINDLSTLSRAERGIGDVIEEIDVNELLHEFYGRYESEAQEKSLRLDLDIDANLPHVETSRLYLEEILQNFITNAIKYTKEGSVTIRASLLPNGRIDCSVSDTGIGMSKGDLKHIFEKFYRSEDYRTRETSGTGLGLYVVRKLADKLETEVKVTSRLNHGSTFSFVLPLKSQRLSVTHAPTTRPTTKQA